VFPSSSSPSIRPYRSPEDAARTFEVFRAAITQTASTVYEPHQIEAWAGPCDIDLGEWDRRRTTATTLVAVIDDQVVGFADLLPDGLVDMLFVDPAAGRRGVARALITRVQHEARERGIAELRTLASRSAQPAFARFGFRVVADRPGNTVRGVVVPNAEMRCRLGTPTLVILAGVPYSGKSTLAGVLADRGFGVVEVDDINRAEGATPEALADHVQDRIAAH